MLLGANLHGWIEIFSPQRALSLFPEPQVACSSLHKNLKKDLFLQLFSVKSQEVNRPSASQGIRKRPGCLFWRYLTAQGEVLGLWGKLNSHLPFSACRQQASDGKDESQGLGEWERQRAWAGLETLPKICFSRQQEGSSLGLSKTYFSMISWQIVRGPNTVSHRPSGI